MFDLFSLAQTLENLIQKRTGKTHSIQMEASFNIPNHLLQIIQNDNLQEFVCQLSLLLQNSEHISRTSENNILLNIALQYNSLNIVEYLLKNGAKVNNIGTNNETPMTLLCKMTDDRTESLHLLLSYNTNDNRSETDQLDHTYIMLCIAAGNMLHLRCLLIHGYNPNTGVNWCGAPTVFAIQNHNINALNILLTYGADVNGPDKYYPDLSTGSLLSKVLHTFSGEQCDIYMKLLIQHGADINHIEICGSPFITSIISRNVRWSQYLANKGCNIRYTTYKYYLGNILGPQRFGLYTALDDQTNMEVWDALNKVFFGSGECLYINIDTLKDPHYCAITYFDHFTNNSLKNLSRRKIRQTLLYHQKNLFSLVKDLPLPKTLKGYLLFN